jgi:hypothetical protein
MLATAARTPTVIPPFAPANRRAFISRGADLQYRAKRASDGQVVASGASRGDVKQEAESLGYFIVG